MKKNTDEKLVIYQVLMRLFGNQNTTRKPNGTIDENGCGKMNDMTTTALKAIKRLGCNAVWYTGLLQQASATDYSRYGIPRHNPQVLKGKAGSPYAISDYYSVSCDLAENPAKRMEEFDALVNRTHDAGLKLFIDFVPNHVARSYKSVTAPTGVRDFGADDDTTKHFSPQNNFYYCLGHGLELSWKNAEDAEGQNYSEFPAKATGNDCFSPYPSRNDWYETVKLNYGVDYCGGGDYHFDPTPSTWTKMLDILFYWCAKGVDGFRCDMVFMVPVDFWHWAIPQVKAKYPNVIFIAEIYDPALYRSYIHYGGFDYLYDKVGLYDTLRAIVECRESATAITRCWQQTDDIHQHLLNFLENHDEQRIASDFFAGDPKKAFPALVVSALMRENPFMCYFGQELGEKGMDEEGFSGRDGRTTIFDYWSLKSLQRLQGKNGRWAQSNLSGETKEIYESYKKIFEFAKLPIFSKGSFYDLQYANFNNFGYDVHRQFAFLRHFQGETMLVVANFDGEDKEISLNVPAEALEYVGIKCDKVKPLRICVPAYDASIVSIG